MQAHFELSAEAIDDAEFSLHAKSGFVRTAASIDVHGPSLEAQSLCVVEDDD